MYEAIQPSAVGRGYLIAELPDRERPRERLLGKGPDSLSDAELLAILLRSGTPGRSVLQLARDVMAAFGGSLSRVAGATVSELRQVRGVGPAKSAEIRAAFALAKRLCSVREEGRTKIRGPRDVAALLRESFRGSRQEEFHVLMLDVKHYLIRSELVTVGLLDCNQIHAREVFRIAIRESCSRIILAHNHPSGDPNPSPQDVKSTSELVAAGEIVGIEVMDHIVLGRANGLGLTEYVSFREAELL